MRKLISWLISILVVALCGGTIIAVLRTFKVCSNNPVLFTYVASLATYAIGNPLAFLARKGYRSWRQEQKNK